MDPCGTPIQRFKSAHSIAYGLSLQEFMNSAILMMEMKIQPLYRYNVSKICDL